MAGKLKWVGWLRKTSSGEAKEGKVHPRFGGVTLVSIDEDWIKLLHAQGPLQKRKIEFLTARAIRGLNDEQVSVVFKKLLQDNHFEGLPIRISHPAAFFRARALKLPSTNRDELRVMVDLQVEKHTPDSKEETRTYFRINETGVDGYTYVFLAMTHQDRVDRSVRAVQQSASRLLEVSSDLDGLIHWYRHFEALPGKKVPGGTLMIDADSHYATVLVLHQGEAYFHRSIPIDLVGMLQDVSGEMLKGFVGEIHRSVMAYEEEGLKGSCSKIALTGCSGLIFGLAQQLEAQMSLPVEILRASAIQSFTKTAAEQMAVHKDVSFTALLGLAASPGVGDLTPPALKMRRIFQEKVKAVGILGGQILLGLFLASLFLVRDVHRDLEYHRWLKTQTQKMEAPARYLETALEHLKVIKGRLEQRGALLDALTVLKQATPPEVRWDQLTYTQNDSLLLKGVSREMPKVFEMVTELEKSSLFVKPEARRVAKRREDGKDVTGFEILMPFWNSER